MDSFFLGGIMVLASIAIGIYAGLYLGLYKGIVRVIGLFRRDTAVVLNNEDIAKAFIFTWLRIFLGVNGGVFIIIILGLPGFMMMLHALLF